MEQETSEGSVMTTVVATSRTVQAGNILIDFSGSGAVTLKGVKGGPLLLVDSQSFQDLVEAAKQGKLDISAPR
jgi:hypothetical protein